MRRALAPLVAGLLGLLGSLGVVLSLHRGAERALDRVLEERLRGAGGTAARLLARVEVDAASLKDVMRENDLEAAYVLSPSLEIVADATGGAGSRADLLRVDKARVEQAFRGVATVASGYAFGAVPVSTGYFPIESSRGAVGAVLALETGESFAGGRAPLRAAMWLGIGLSVVGAITFAALSWVWARAERERERVVARAARGDALSRMAAMVAHEVRNPLGVIRGAVELVQERSGPVVTPLDRQALSAVLAEVERLRALTQDFLDLAREPSLTTTCVDLAAVAAEAVRGVSFAYTQVAVEVNVPELQVRGDPGRLRQALANLLLNAAQAGARTIRIDGSAAEGFARIAVRDDGPGIDARIRGRLFEPFATGRVDGTGLGLAIARSVVERHGGELKLVASAGHGAAFVIRLPLAAA